MQFAMRRLATSAALPVITRAARTSLPSAFATPPARHMAIGINSASYLTPGFKPHEGTHIPEEVELWPAMSWDEGVAAGFPHHGYEHIFAGKKIVLFSVPGAFTGVCEKAHVPSYSKNVEAFKAKGVDMVICVAVNDPYVMNAWAKSMGDGAKGIQFYADMRRELTKYMHMDTSLKAAGLGPGKRSQRYCMLVEDGIIKIIREEKDPGDLKVTSGDALLAEMK